MKLKYNIQYFLFYCGAGSIYPLLSRYLSDSLNFSGSQIGIILGIPSLIALMTLPLFGAMYDNAKKPKFIIMGLLICVSLVALFIPGFRSFGIVMALITMIELLSKPASVMLDSLTVRASDELKFEFGNVRKFGSIGYIVISVVIANLTKSFPLQIIFYSYAIFMTLSALNMLNFTTYPNEGSSHEFIKELKVLIKNKQYFYVIIIYSALFGVANVALNYDGVRIEELGYGAEYMALLVPSFVFFEIVLLRYSDRIITKFGYKKPLFIGGLIIALKWLVYAFTTNIYIYILMASMHGIMLALVMPTTFRYIKNIVSPKVHATSMTILNSVFLLTLAIFNFLTGVIIEVSSFQVVFILYMIIALSGTLLVSRIKEA